MEAPEKIYVNITHPISDEYTEIIAFEDGEGIEYTRTDAFIDKACEYWYEYNRDVLKRQGAYTTVNVEDFKNYLKRL